MCVSVCVCAQNITIPNSLMLHMGTNVNSAHVNKWSRVCLCWIRLWSRLAISRSKQLKKNKQMYHVKRMLAAQLLIHTHRYSQIQRHMTDEWVATYCRVTENRWGNIRMHINQKITLYWVGNNLFAFPFILKYVCQCEGHPCLYYGQHFISKSVFIKHEGTTMVFLWRSTLNLTRHNNIVKVQISLWNGSTVNN